MNNKKRAVAFGEILLHLSAPDDCGIKDSDRFYANYGGTEANVLACLTALSHSTAYLTALPEGDFGEAVIKHLNHFGIDTSLIKIKGDTLGMYFSEVGEASRGTKVVYYRRHSEFTKLDEQSFDYDRVFEDAALFHISGISFALSPSSRALAFRLMKEARARGVRVSFDFNYRASLWSTDEAREQFVKAAELADVLLASHRDLVTFLQIGEGQIFSRFPCDTVTLRDREVLSRDRHRVQVTLLQKDGTIYRSPTTEFAVKERVGGGDAFDGALLHALVSGMDAKSAVLFAVAAFALKHTIEGDTFTLKEKDILAYEKELFGAEL